MHQWFFDLAKKIRKVELKRYHLVYPELLNFAAKLDDDETGESLLALCHMMYGWMPTILNSTNFANFGLCNGNILHQIRAVPDVSTAIGFVNRMNDVAPVNRSWVGTSKVLHIVNQRAFPIWDSRVAKHFGLKGAGRCNQKKHYLKYLEFVRGVCADPRAELLAEKIGQELGYCVTPVRAVETVLFEAEPDRILT